MLTMKKIILPLLLICLAAFSCIKDEEPFIIINETDITFSDEGATQSISFESNMKWTANSSKGWCVVSPASGDPSIKSINITLSDNESYVGRSCSVSIMADKLIKSITINQDGKEPYVYWVKEMGTLGTILNQTQKDTITTMILKGEINKSDFEIMKFKMPKLRYLDLKDVKCEGDRIPAYAFGEGQIPNKDITTIILPVSILTIGSGAFAHCSGLTGSLVLPSRLIKIEEGAFYNCTGFNGTLTLPAGLETIEKQAFWLCKGFIGSLKLPSKLRNLGEYAFYFCEGFNGSLTFPSELRAIYDSAFYGCSGFTGTLNLPSDLKIIGSNAFDGCSGFTGLLNLPNDLKTIGREAFIWCYGFDGLQFGSNITTIDDYAFYYCNNISGKVKFPISLNSLKENTFKFCNKVDSFRFPHTIPLKYYNDMLPIGATVEVPTDAVPIYKVSDGWKSYNIVGY